MNGVNLTSRVHERFVVLANGDLALGRDRTLYAPEVGLTFEIISTVSSANHIFEKHLT